MCNDDVHDNRLLIIGKLTANLIHDLRNPLSVIKLNLEYLNMLEKKLPDEVNISLDNTSKAVLKIQDLIENLSEFTKPTFDSISLIETVNYAIDFIKGSARRFNVVIENNLSSLVPDLCMDRNKILQVLLNLMTNLIEVSGSGSKITIENNFDEDENVILEIRTSSSIKNDKQKIKKSSKKNEGAKNSFGLSVCQTILEEFHADLSVESDENNSLKFMIKFQPLLIQQKNELMAFMY